MNSEMLRDVLRFFLDGLTLRQFIHMLIILIILILFTPEPVKVWIEFRNPEVIPQHWMYYVSLFCISYLMNNAINHFFKITVQARKKWLLEKEERETKENLDRVFSDLSKCESLILAFAVDGENNVNMCRGNKDTLTLLRRGLLVRTGRAIGSVDKDSFRIPGHLYHECYLRFSGKLEKIYDEAKLEDQELSRTNNA